MFGLRSAQKPKKKKKTRRRSDKVPLNPHPPPITPMKKRSGQNATQSAKKPRRSARNSDNQKIARLGPCYVGNSRTLESEPTNSIHWEKNGNGEGDGDQFFAVLPSDIVHFQLLNFTNTFECLILMRTSKAARKRAAQKLKTICSKVSLHQQMFQTFLASPRVTKANRVLCDELTKVPSKQLAGPLRLDVLSHNAQRLSQQFVVLNYEKTYDSEKSEVCIVDSRGNFVSYYDFSSDQFYEDYVTKDVKQENGTRAFNTSFGKKVFMSPMRMRVRTASQAQPLVGRGIQMEYWERGGWMGDIAFENKDVILSTLDIISPTETMFILMHALSSDTRGIYVLTVSTFDCLRSDFHMFPEGLMEEEFQREISQAREYGILLQNQQYLHPSVKTLNLFPEDEG